MVAFQTLQSSAFNIFISFRFSTFKNGLPSICAVLPFGHCINSPAVTPYSLHIIGRTGYIQHLCFLSSLNGQVEFGSRVFNTAILRTSGRSFMCSRIFATSSSVAGITPQHFPQFRHLVCAGMFNSAFISIPPTYFVNSNIPCTRYLFCIAQSKGKPFQQQQAAP